MGLSRPLIVNTVLVIIIDIVLLLWSCSNIMEAPPGQAPSSGKGIVTVSIGDVAARTLLPQGSFDYFDLTFTQSGKATVTLNRLPAGTGGTVELDPGNWKAAATAYVIFSGITYTAAEGEKEIIVEAGAAITESISLTVPVLGGRGRFSYDIELADKAIDNAVLTMTPLSEGGRAQSFDLLAEPKQNDLLFPSGYYLMTISARKGPASAGKTDVVHIYSGLETAAEGEKYRIGSEDFQTSVYIFGNNAVIAGNAYSYQVAWVHAYRDAGGIQKIDSWKPGSDGKWSLSIPIKDYQGNVYIRMELAKGEETILSNIQPVAIGVSGGEIVLEAARIYKVNAYEQTVVVSGSSIVTGRITASPELAAEGAFITLTLSPAIDGLRFSGGSLRERNGTVSAFQTIKENEQYRFSMPGNDVNPEADFTIKTELESITVIAGTGSGSTVSVYALNKVFDPGVTEYAVQLPSAITSRIIDGSAASNRVTINPVALVKDSRLYKLSYKVNSTDWLTPGTQAGLVNNDKLTIRVASNLGDNIYKEYNLTIHNGSTVSLPQITGFSFTRSNNAAAINITLSRDLISDVNQSQRTITNFFKPYSNFNYYRVSGYPKHFYWWIKETGNVLSLKPTFTLSSGAKLYAGNVEITSNTTPIDLRSTKVLIVKNGSYEQEYQLIFDSPQMTGLPVMKITMNPPRPLDEFGRPKILREWLPADYEFYDESGAKAFSGPVEIHLRGYSSSGISYDVPITQDQVPYLPKLPYAIKLGTKQPLVGLPSHKRWNMTANVFDPSLIRNDIVFAMAKTMDKQPWVPNTRDVVFYLDDEFLGLYTMQEAVKLDQGRIPVTNIISASNPDGGYLLEFDSRAKKFYDNGYGTEFYFQTSKLNPSSSYRQYYWTCDTPDTDLKNMITSGEYAGKMTVMQKMQKEVQQFEDALFGSNLTHPVTGERYTKYLDLPSFIDWFLVQEFTMNNDANMHASIFVYLNPDNRKLYFCPVWDFDVVIGNYWDKGNGNYDTNKWRLKGRPHPEAYAANYYIDRFFMDAEFKTALKTRWNEKGAAIMQGLLDAIANKETDEKFQKAMELNFRKHRFSEAYDTFDNNALDLGNRYQAQRTIQPNWAVEAQYMKNWITNRYTWLNTAINGL